MLAMDTGRRRMGTAASTTEEEEDGERRDGGGRRRGGGGPAAGSDGPPSDGDGTPGTSPGGRAEAESKIKVDVEAAEEEAEEEGEVANSKSSPSADGPKSTSASASATGVEESKSTPPARSDENDADDGDGDGVKVTGKVAAADEDDASAKVDDDKDEAAQPGTGNSVSAASGGRHENLDEREGEGKGEGDGDDEGEAVAAAAAETAAARVAVIMAGGRGSISTHAAAAADDKEGDDDERWEEYFGKLEIYTRRLMMVVNANAHADAVAVHSYSPRRPPPLPEADLVEWATDQRVARLTGKLSRVRVRRLTNAGFKWDLGDDVILSDGSSASASADSVSATGTGGHAVALRVEASPAALTVGPVVVVVAIRRVSPVDPWGVALATVPQTGDVVVTPCQSFADRRDTASHEAGGLVDGGANGGADGGGGSKRRKRKRKERDVPPRPRAGTNMVDSGFQEGDVVVSVASGDDDVLPGVGGRHPLDMIVRPESLGGGENPETVVDVTEGQGGNPSSGGRALERERERVRWLESVADFFGRCVSLRVRVVRRNPGNVDVDRRPTDREAMPSPPSVVDPMAFVLGQVHTKFC